MSIAGPGVRHVFVHDILVQASIGTYAFEEQQRQPVRVNVDLAVAEGVTGRDRLADVLNYEAIVEAVRDIVGTGHTRLVETLAERIAAACLGDSRVLLARVRVEKLAAFTDAGAAGVEVERRKSSTGTD